MESFSETLPDGRTLNGLLSFPLKPSASIDAPYRPLVICVHGGSYSADYFDACPSTSIFNVSTPLSVPVISISRPGYGGSTPLPPTPAPNTGITFIQETGKHLHKTILPFLWEKYGPRLGANCIVLLSHSIGSAVAIVAAALHAEATTYPPSYPLAGLICQGIGTNVQVLVDNSYDPNAPTTDEAHYWPQPQKDDTMLGPASRGLCPPEVRAQADRLNHKLRIAERRDIQRAWAGYWRRYSEAVTVPLLYGLAGEDAMWEVSEELVTAFVDAFPRCVRREGGLVLGAPHCLELSYAGRGWLVRCVGFAMECAFWWGTRNGKGEAGRKREGTI
ncbi:MAG: hypothetical protein M1822_008532 [Bathelium mastoideum]|nr:MAG: hypothetical protein M1822_008532 [Bathelium mastoideum]